MSLPAVGIDPSFS